MITIKTKEEIEKMRKAGEILAKIHLGIKDMIRPGITTMQIDAFAEKYMRDHGATPEQKGFEGFPYATCASVNDVICHGFPNHTPLKDGDIVTIDMVVNLNGYLADSAWSFAVGKISEEAKKLMYVTKECMYAGIEKAVIGNRLGDIGQAVQELAEANGFSVVRDFCGHGIDTNMHEEPQVLHYGNAGRGLRLMEGMVITVEPMINAGKWQCKIDADGWTARTVDGSLSCQYEHTFAITKDGPDILTDQSKFENR